ncbi:MAG: flavin reductase [Candidatus Aenigmarchaeota archaeon]|nr:flavin reductase [Candidatus Aenigmarchaeota archaeon]
MDIPYGSNEAAKFVTNVGLITSDGPNGPNVMAVEWTHQIAYKPGLIAISVHPADATAENIQATKEFGVNIAAEDQNTISSIAGGSHGQRVDKVGVLKELGIEFYDAKKIKAPMVKGAVLNAECKVVFSKDFGDHTLFIGEAVDVSIADKEPLLYHGGKYFKVGEHVTKPGQETMDKIKILTEKHAKHFD